LEPTKNGLHLLSRSWGQKIKCHSSSERCHHASRYTIFCYIRSYDNQVFFFIWLFILILHLYVWSYSFFIKQGKMSLEFLSGHFSWVAHNILLLCLLFHAVVLSEPQNSFILSQRGNSWELGYATTPINTTTQGLQITFLPPVDFLVLLLLSLIKNPPIERLFQTTVAVLLICRVINNYCKPKLHYSYYY
jgi:hypothetical protein